MSWFCKHDWVNIKETYTQTLVEQGMTELSGVSMDIRRILAHGMTTIIFQCSMCKNLHTVEMLGKEREAQK